MTLPSANEESRTDVLDDEQEARNVASRARLHIAEDSNGKFMGYSSGKRPAKGKDPEILTGTSG